MSFVDGKRVHRFLIQNFYSFAPVDCGNTACRTCSLRIGGAHSQACSKRVHQIQAGPYRGGQAKTAMWCSGASHHCRLIESHIHPHHAITKGVISSGHGRVCQSAVFSVTRRPMASPDGLDEEVARILSHTPTFGERAVMSHTASPEVPEVWLPPSRQPSFTRTPAASDDEGGARVALRRPFSSEAGLYFSPD